VVPNRGPEMMIGDEKIVGGENDAILVGQATAVPTAKPSSGALGGGTSWVTSLPPSADDLFGLLRQNLAPIEGGYANRPKSVDPGGPTKKGVSQDLLDKLHKNKSTEYGGYPTATKNLTDTQIDTILRKEIFNPLHLWEVAQIPGLLNDAPQLVDQLFDMGVLHGIDDPGRILQMSLHEVMGIDLRVMKNGKRDYDGIIGPATRSALSQAVLAGRGVEINDLMVDKRLDKLNKQGHKVHNPGWFPRAESFRISPSPLPGTP